MNKTLIAILCAAANLLLGSCTSSTEAQKPTITVSIEPQRWLLERIVGEKIEVNTILSAGADPESFEPSISGMKTLERSICYMKMGNFGFEGAIAERIASNLSDILIINTADSVPLIIEHDHEHCPGGHAHGIDPHVWNSAKNARIIARNMYRTVIKLDSINKEYYTENYNRLQARIDSIDSICELKLRPMEGSAFIVWHPSLSYFARDYELHQIAIGSEGKELSINETERVIQLIQKNEASVFLVEGSASADRTQVIAAELPELRTHIINPLNYEWDKELVQTASAIAGE